MIALSLHLHEFLHTQEKNLTPCLTIQNVHNGVLLAIMSLDFQLYFQLESYVKVNMFIKEVKPSLIIVGSSKFKP